MMSMFDSKMYVEAYSSLHASEDTLAQVMKKAAGAQKMKRKFLPALAVLLILTVSVAAFAGGGMTRGAWRFHGSLKDIEKMGVCCPEQIGTYRMDEHSIDRYHVVNEETGELNAFFRPDYIWMSVNYEKSSRQGLSISFGPMDHPLWAYVSHYDLESNVWDGVLHPEIWTRHDETQGSFTYIGYVTEYTYRNCTIYLYDRITEYTETADTAPAFTDCRNACAVWTDPDRGMWFCMEPFDILWETDEEDSCSENREGVTQEEMMGYAEEIIDRCR